MEIIIFLVIRLKKNYDHQFLVKNFLFFSYVGVLVGNKTDKENYRVVSAQEGKQLATSRKMGFFECSAVC